MEKIRTLRSDVLGSNSEIHSAKLATSEVSRIPGFGNSGVSDIDRVLSKRSFYFQKRFGKINLEAIRQISIQHVQDQVDIELLQQNLEMIVFGDLEASDAVSDIDESFSKLFRLSQLTVEYLLSVQDSLADMLDVTSKQCRASETKLKKARGRIRERDATISHLKQYIRNRQSALEWYKLQLPGGGPIDSRARGYVPGGTAQSSVAPSPSVASPAGAPTPDLRGVVPQQTAPIATLPPEVLAKLETIGSTEANMQKMIDELRQSKESMAEELRLSTQKWSAEITALKEASTAAPVAPKEAAVPDAGEAKPQQPNRPGGFGEIVDDSSPKGGGAGWNVDIAELKTQITSLQEKVNQLLEAKVIPPPSASVASVASIATSPIAAAAKESNAGAAAEAKSPVSTNDLNDPVESPAEKALEAAPSDDMGTELSSSNHPDDFLPICFENVSAETSFVRTQGAKSLSQCDLSLILTGGAEDQENFKAGTFRLDHWIESPDCEGDVHSGVQCLNDALQRKVFEDNVKPQTAQDLQNLAHQAKLSLDIIVLSDDGSTVQAELKDSTIFDAPSLCFLQFKGGYFSAYSVEAMQEHVYNRMAPTKKMELGIAEQLGGSAERVALSSSTAPVLKSSFDILKAIVTKDLKLSFIGLESGSVVSEEQVDDIMVLHSHAAPGPRQSTTELEEEYAKLAKLKEQLDSLDHSDVTAISELSSVQYQFDSIAETISKIP